MTRDEALAELGLTSAGSSDELRRAYLRALKHKKPERDPEGFQRIRAAYDLLSTGVAFPVPVERFDTTNEPKPRRAPPQIRIEPIRIEPIRIEPELVARTEVVAIPRVDGGESDIELALDKGDLARAASLVIQRFATASIDDEPPVQLGIHVTLRLYEDDQLALARTVGAWVAHWLYHFGDERRSLGRGLVVTWSQLRDLDALPDDVVFAPEVRTALARYARDRDVASARASMSQYRARVSRADAAQAAIVIRTFLPSFKALAPCVAPLPRFWERELPITARGWRWIYRGVIATFLVGLVLAMWLTTADTGAVASRPDDAAELRALVDRARELRLSALANLVVEADEAGAATECARAQAAIDAIPATLRDASAEARALRPQLLALVARVGRNCPGLLPASAVSSWPLLSPSAPRVP